MLNINESVADPGISILGVGGGGGLVYLNETTYISVCSMFVCSSNLHTKNGPWYTFIILPTHFKYLFFIVCNDKARNCADYGQRVCQPPYDTWGRQNCPLFCGFCTGKRQF